jgi:hypothetical protein
MGDKKKKENRRIDTKCQETHIKKAGLRCLLEMQAAHDLLEYYFIASSNSLTQPRLLEEREEAAAPRHL